MSDEQNPKGHKNKGDQLTPNTKRGLLPAKNPPKMPTVKPPKKDK